MKIFEHVVVEKVESQLRGILCNKCGEVFEPNYGNTTQQFDTATTGEYNGTYPSPFKFDLCESCLTNFVKTFKLVPDNFMNESGYTPAFITDHELHQSLFEEWQKTGEWNYDDNPWPKKSDNYNECSEEIHEDYEEFSDATEDRNPLYTGNLTLVK